MREQRFQHLKAICIHFMQFCSPWITHKKWHSNTFRSSFKMKKKILVSNIFYHFLFAVSLGNKTSKMSEKFRLDRKIGFQNTFYTKCIHVIIESIGPSIILRSIVKINTAISEWYLIRFYATNDTYITYQAVSKKVTWRGEKLTGWGKTDKSIFFPEEKNDRWRSVFSRRKNGPAHPFHVEKLTRENWSPLRVTKCVGVTKSVLAALYAKFWSLWMSHSLTRHRHLCPAS